MSDLHSLVQPQNQPTWSLHHVTLAVKPGTLPLAREFYGQVLALPLLRGVPRKDRDILLWYALNEMQELHISVEHDGAAMDAQPWSARHTCLQLPSKEALQLMGSKIKEHMRTDALSRAISCEDPEQVYEGPHGLWMLMVRDYSGNSLELVAPN